MVVEVVELWHYFETSCQRAELDAEVSGHDHKADLFFRCSPLRHSAEGNSPTVIYCAGSA